MRSRSALSVIACRLLLALAALSSAAAGAAVITVDGFDSTVSSVDQRCTLREAIASANLDVPSGGLPGECPAGSGADSLVLTGDVTLSVVDHTDGGVEGDGPSGLPLITSEILLEGGGFSITQQSGAADFRVFRVAAAGQLELRDLTIFGVASTFNGGPVWASGVALMNRGTATLRRCTIRGNAGLNGGGIANFGTLTVVESTLSDNVAGAGGGIQHLTGTLTLQNTTLSGNRVIVTGGGLAHQGGVATLEHCSLVGNENTSPFGPGGDALAVLGGTLTLTGSVIADGPGDSCVGSILDGGGNFDDDGTCPRDGGLTGLDLSLADNGGPTWTHALLAGSSAIDAAGSCGLATDQRGIARDTSCDAGAVEFVCGDGVLQAGEDCDDGNNQAWDCCSPGCRFETLIGTPPCCASGACQVGQGCGAVCFTAGGECQQPGGPGTLCSCSLP